MFKVPSKREKKVLKKINANIAYMQEMILTDRI